MGIQTGEKFIVIGEGNTIVLKKVEMPSFDEVSSLLKKTRSFVKKGNINKSDLKEAIKKARKR